MCLMLIGLCRPHRFDSSYETTDKPDGFNNPPKRLLCSRCGKISEGVYRQEYKTFVCFFIPCTTNPVNDPFISCSKCSQRIEKMPQPPCKKCNVTRTFESDYCPMCGTKK